MHRPPNIRSWLLLLVLVVAVATSAPGASAAPTKQHLSVNIGSMPSSLDPGRAMFTEDLVVQNALFAPLYRSPGGSAGRLQPFLAVGQPRVSLGGRRYDVRLRSARWSDGTPIKAADVVFAFNRARRVSYYGREFNQVRSVQAIGPRAVRFTLREPVPWFGELLASNVVTPVPSHAIRRFSARWTQLDKLVVSGPFRAKSMRGRTELVLEPNATWWGASQVRLQQVQLLAVPVAAASPLFRAARIDATLRDTSIHPSTRGAWQRDRRYRIAPTGAARYLFLNVRSPALASAAVRRGIALAIDRSALTQATSHGVDRPLSTIVPRSVRGSSSVVQGGGSLLRSDGAANSGDAAAQLAAGGWNRTAELQLFYAGDDNTSPQVATAIQANLAGVGVRVVLRPGTTAQMAKVGIGVSPVADGVDMVLQGWQPDYSDPQSFHQLFTCSAVELGLNASNFCAPEFDAADALASRTGGAARVTALGAAEQLLTGANGLMPAVPLYEPMGEHLVQPWVQGFVQQPSGRVDFERVAISQH